MIRIVSILAMVGVLIGCGTVKTISQSEYSIARDLG